MHSLWGSVQLSPLNSILRVSSPTFNWAIYLWQLVQFLVLLKFNFYVRVVAEIFLVMYSFR